MATRVPVLREKAPSLRPPQRAISAAHSVNGQSVPNGISDPTAYLYALTRENPLASVAQASDGTISMCNPAFQALFGYTETEAVGQDLDSLIAPPDRMGEARALTHRSAGEVVRLETKRRRKDGSLVEVQIIGVPLVVNGQAIGSFAIYQDITERLRAEEAQRRAEEKFRSLFENAVEGIFQTTPSGRHLEVNPALARMCGYSSPAEMMASVQDIGTTIYVDAQRREEFKRLMEEQGVVAAFEYQIRRKDGAKIWVSEHARAVRDGRGQIAYYEGTVQDITDRKQLEDQFRQAQKMEAVGRLAGGIAHDFNNLLMVIQGYSDLLAERLADGPLHHNLEQIQTAAQRASALTRQLLAFSRKQMLAPATLNLHGIVADMEKILQRIIGEDIRLETATCPGLWPVKADRSQIEQVIMNLVINARDAMPSGGRLAIETANVERDRPFSCNSAIMPAGEYILLAVTDTGSGMDPETQAHLFEPFFTTKEKGKGTGLGLATVYGIVKQSGGYIWVYSELERGTSLKIYLPRANSEATASCGGRREHRHDSLPETLRGSETVLLVEDERGVRELAREYLESSGYKVIEAENGHMALELAGLHKAPIHLLLTDVVMPGISGRELAERICAMRPEVKVLFMSGYTDQAMTGQNENRNGHALLANGSVLLQKPFTLATLAAKLREVLLASVA